MSSSVFDNIYIYILVKATYMYIRQIIFLKGKQSYNRFNVLNCLLQSPINRNCHNKAIFPVLVVFCKNSTFVVNDGLFLFLGTLNI